MASNVNALKALGYNGSTDSTFSKAGSFFKLPSGKTYTKSPFGGGDLGTQENNPFVVAQKAKATNNLQMIPAHTQSAPTLVQAAAPQQQVTQPVAKAPTLIDWSKRSDVPHINKPNVTVVEPEGLSAEQAEAMRQQSVSDAQANDARIREQTVYDDMRSSVQQAESRTRDLDNQAEIARGMMANDGIGGLIVGQSLMKGINDQRQSQAGNDAAVLQARQVTQKNLADSKLAGIQSLAQIMNAESERMMVNPKISLLGAQAEQARQAGLLSGTEAKYYPDTISIKNQTLQNDVADKALTHKIALLSAAYKDQLPGMNTGMQRVAEMKRLLQ